ncbi:SubName: Full=Uncharacterized protein {ECO:0000313/EMBL:CCA72920.1} [Serendipita indica DSM 11827]|nr:SubName: Full=Uncharacterized protein {ECO:0000313/EMBL:CCA72920.1} [Serendipita indica DSM 11827]
MQASHEYGHKAIPDKKGEPIRIDDTVKTANEDSLKGTVKDIVETKEEAQRYGARHPQVIIQEEQSGETFAKNPREVRSAEQ